MRRSLSQAGRLERARGICAIAASAVLIGVPVFGASGASGHGNHGNDHGSTPGFQTGSELGQAGTSLAHDGNHSGDGQGNGGWHGDGGSSGGAGSWHDGGSGSGDGGNSGHSSGNDGGNGGNGGGSHAPAPSYQAAPQIAAPQAPAPQTSAPSVEAHGGPSAWASHGDGGGHHGSDNGGGGQGDGGSPAWAGKGHGHGHGDGGDNQNSQGQSSSSTATRPSQTSHRTNVGSSGPTATPASAGSSTPIPVTPAATPAPAPAAAPAPTLVPAPAPASVTPAPAPAAVVVPVATKPAAPQSEAGRHGAALPSFDSTTSLVGSLSSLTSRLFAAGGTLSLSPTAAAAGPRGLHNASIGSLPAANTALGLSDGSAGTGAGTAAGGALHASTRPAAARHSGGDSSSAPIIEVVPNVIDHFVNVIPGVVWIALAASLGIGLAGAGAAVAFRHKAHRQAGRIAAIAAAALTDPLTGVLNRRGFTEAVERELARARRYGRQFVLAYVDVRGLKAVNDTEGHLAGDELLKGVAALLADSARADDVVGRLGGDELGLLLAEQTPETAAAVTQRIEEEVAKRRAALGLSAPWSLTIGTAAYPEDGETFDDLIRTADRRLYEQRGIAIP